MKAYIKQNKVEIAKSLFGIIPDDGTTLKEVREERFARYETHKVDFIVTRDLKHYEGSPVRAAEPEEILKSL